MSKKSERSKAFDSSNIVLFAWKWKTPLIVISLATSIVAFIFSSPPFVYPRYKSTVVVFPSNTYSVSKALLPQQFATGNQDILQFGEEQQAEQLLQILNSDEIKNIIVQEFDLMKHYRIKSNNKYKNTSLAKTYDKNISYRRTEFMSVEIKVLDESPDTAALIANRISDLLDEVKNRIQRERAEKGLKIVEQEYTNLRNEIKEKENELTQLRFMGVHDYESQVGVLTEQLGIAINKAGENSRQAREIERRLDTLAKYGGTYVSIRDELTSLKDELVKLKTKYDQAKVDVNETLPSIFKVNTAYPAERKTYPVRSVILLISFLSAFVFTLIVLIVLETIKKSNT